MPLRIASVTIDCHDIAAMVRFWSTLLGYVPHEGDESGSVEDPRDRDVELVFVRVPEDKGGKNRAHLDIGADDQEAEVRRACELGAEVVRVMTEWTVMRDPEGNEFCILDVDPGDPLESWRT